MRKETATCPICGQSFERRAMGGEKSKPACSKECLEALRQQRWEETGEVPNRYEVVACDHCGKKFLAAKSHHRRFCSQDCQHIAQRRKEGKGGLASAPDQVTTPSGCTIVPKKNCRCQRYIKCVHQETCLDIAVACYWPGWACIDCKGFKPS